MLDEIPSALIPPVMPPRPLWMPLVMPLVMPPVRPLLMPLVSVVAAVAYDVKYDDGIMDDAVIPVANVAAILAPSDVLRAGNVGPVVRGCSNWAKIRLSCMDVPP